MYLLKKDALYMNKKYYYIYKTTNVMRESKKGLGCGEKNSQFGTCWITKEGINKKIKLIDLELFLINGWIKGRKI